MSNTESTSVIDLDAQPGDDIPAAVEDPQADDGVPAEPPRPPEQPAATHAGRAAAKKPAAKQGKKAAKAQPKKQTQPRADAARGRVRPFPASSFEDAAELANTMHRMGSDNVRRLTLFEQLGRSADSGTSRQQIINSGRYGITTGGIRAEFITLTEDGSLATNPEAGRRPQLRARFRLAIEEVEPFNRLYEEFAGKRLPSQAVMRDFLRDKGLADGEIQECIDTFIVNAQFLGLLRTIAGAERLLTLDHVLDELPAGDGGMPSPELTSTGSPSGPVPRVGDHGNVDWTKVCFYVSPIGSEDSEQREHADLFLGSFVEPALRDFDLTVVRADQIGKAGMITAQVIEHLANARIVIADLSFHNPNVFYEIALRHAVRKPIVQIIRAADPIPFDLDQLRTIRIDTTSIFTLVPKIETYQSEIAAQVRRALEGNTEVDNPITVFYARFWHLIAKSAQAA